MKEPLADQKLPTEQQLASDLAGLLALNLGLPVDAIPADPRTRVLGAIPELDSMSVVTFLVTLEEEYGIEVYDDEVSAAVFETVGSLTRFVASKLST